MRLILLVGLCGAVGAIARLTLSEWVYRLAGRGFPYGTLVVNSLGCLLIGALAYAGANSSAVPESWRVGLSAGFLGGLTTFSTFGYETFDHLGKGHWAIAGGNVVLSVCIGVLSVGAGMAIARLLID